MAVTEIEITSRSFLADGLDFGELGPYEQLEGTVQIAVDPDHPRNGVITDLKLAPRDPNGLVSCSSDFCILSPNPPKDTDGRREDSGRGWVRELQGRWPGVLG